MPERGKPRFPLLAFAVLVAGLVHVLRFAVPAQERFLMQVLTYEQTTKYTVPWAADVRREERQPQQQDDAGPRRDIEPVGEQQADAGAARPDDAASPEK